MAELVIARTGSLGQIRLNRPEAINALTHGMVTGIAQAIDGFLDDPQVAAILLTGEGQRGLCAGGDIRSLWQAPRRADGPAMAFWRDEYRLNALIAACPKPVVAWMDGLVMGGGMGISAHAALRVVTERSRIGYPECGIGFVPDVGASWLLPRAPGQMGLWMALSGRSLDADQAIWMGLADVRMAADRLPQLVAGLQSLPPGCSLGAVRALAEALAEPAAVPALAADRPMIDRVFRGDDLPAMLARLAAEDGPLARETHAEILARSPTSLKLALALMRHGARARRLQDALAAELAVAGRLVLGPDFYEGIRAAIIDKDRRPVWQPAGLHEVSDAWVAAALTPLDPPLFPEGACAP